MAEQTAGDVQGKVVVITGAARGMGRAYAEAFVKAGAQVVATDLTWDSAEGFRDELTSVGALPLVMDVRDEGQIDAACAATLDRFDTVDVLLNNAGMRQRDLYPLPASKTVLETADDDWERMFAVNVFGTLKVTRRFVRPMIERRRGSVIMILTSGAEMNPAGDGVWRALRPNSREQPYTASKAALQSIACYLADELKEHNVAVNAVYPGHTRTTGSDEQQAARIAAGRPAAAMLRPEHVVPLALHLATQDAGGVTGQVIDAVRWNSLHGHGDPESWRFVGE